MTVMNTTAHDGSGYNRKSSDHRFCMPDLYVEGAMEIVITGLGTEVSFNENSDQVYIPSELEIQRNGDRLLISMPDYMNNSTAHITVGTLVQIEGV